jgi:hypothetical protein
METFVIQIGTQTEDRETRSDDFQGVVEHVGSGRRQAFVGARELLALLRADYRGLTKEDER